MYFWEKQLDKELLPSLQQDIFVDTLIIGGGLTGLTTLYYLRQEKSICLVEARQVGSGITLKTTGKLTYLQNTIYSDLEKNIDYTTAQNYLQSQRLALSLIKEIIEKENISCHLEKVHSYVFTNSLKEIKKLKAEKTFLEQNNVLVEENTFPLDIEYKESIGVEDTYVFHPIEFINHLKKINKNKIYEQTKIIKIKRKKGMYICKTDKGFIIKARKVILACHYPFFLFPFFLPLKSHIEKSYLMVSKVLKNPKLSCITVSNPGLSIRYYEDKTGIYEICVGGSQKTSDIQNEEQNFKDLEQQFSSKKRIVCEWSNQDLITNDYLPFIGQVKKNMYLATGYNTWGMTNSILAAYLMSKKIKEGKMPYEDLFSLYRCNYYQLKNSFKTIFFNLKAFLKSKKINKEWYPSTLVFSKDKKVAFYKDQEGNTHSVYTTCPHLGCSLLFNEKEKTWDCPCHSSRFTRDGKWMEGPSKKDITYKVK